MREGCATRGAIERRLEKNDPSAAEAWVDQTGKRPSRKVALVQPWSETEDLSRILRGSKVNDEGNQGAMKDGVVTLGASWEANREVNVHEPY